MPTTDLLGILFPTEDQVPFWDIYKAAMGQFDSLIYASLENQNLILTGGGTVTLNTTTNELTWTENFHLLNLTTGGKVVVEAATLAGFEDGKTAYVTVSRPIAGSVLATLSIADTLAAKDTSKVWMALRVGSAVNMRSNVNRANLVPFTYFDATKIVTAEAASGGGDVTGSIALGISNGDMWRLQLTAVANTVDSTIQLYADVGMTDLLYEAANEDCYTSSYDDRASKWIGGLTDGLLYYKITNDGANNSTYNLEISGFGEAIE